MESAKRKRPGDGRNDSGRDTLGHVDKKMADSKEKDYIHQHEPSIAFSSGGNTQASPQEQENNTPQQVDVVAAINVNHQPGGTYNEAVNCGDDIDGGTKLETRVVNLEKYVGEIRRARNEFVGRPVNFDMFSIMIDAISKERDKIHDELDIAQKKLKSAQKQNEQLSEDLERIGSARQSAPDLDEALESQFRDLRQVVRSFTRQCCDLRISTSSLPDNVKSVLAEISGISTELPTATINRRELWRTMTGQLLNDIASTPTLRLEGWREVLVSHIEPLVSTDYRNGIAAQIEPIIQLTIEFAKNLARSRTCCILLTRPFNTSGTVSQPYDGRWMEVIEKSIDHFEDIDFIVTPALAQLTNSAGEEFDTPRFLVQAEVCFGQGPFKSPARPILGPLSNEGRQTEKALSDRRALAVKGPCDAADEAESTDATGANDSGVPDSGSEYEPAEYDDD
ncbi:hypothetical protein EKO27_g7707 [Xylaria grammica]|uniref:Uncharacterized protein n=1 Tax=Xylaria grammica TaxID=363999 RepID=A0A439CZI3_9PEZI|nr:hypothetical protein EKO27_g7707 [Xylaria grammica]